VTRDYSLLIAEFVGSNTVYLIFCTEYRLRLRLLSVSNGFRFAVVTSIAFVLNRIRIIGCDYIEFHNVFSYAR